MKIIIFTTLLACLSLTACVHDWDHHSSHDGNRWHSNDHDWHDGDHRGYSYRGYSGYGGYRSYR